MLAFLVAGELLPGIYVKSIMIIIKNNVSIYFNNI